MPGLSRMRARLATLTVCAAALLQAGPPLTTIQDTLYKADGTRFEGIAQIQWNSFQAYEGSEVSQQVLQVRVISGVLRVALVPTTNAARPLTYTVKFNADGRTQFVEHWAVPPSVTPLRLKDIRVSGQPGNLTDPGSEVTIASVTGLRTELDQRPTKGASFTASRAAMINGSGALDAVIGSSGDCVRVDGTAGPCGAGSAPIFVDGESPTGVMNGSNRVFTLGSAPAPLTSLSLFRDGQLLRQGTDFTLTGATVTMAPAHPPMAGDTLQAWYRLAPSGTPSVDFVDSEVPAGIVNGTNAVFTLANTPTPAASVRVFRNGLLQKLGADYTFTVNTISFLPSSVPTAGEILQVSYRR